MRTRIMIGLGILALICAAGCSGRIRDPAAPSPKLTGTSYFEAGTELFLGVDLRAAWVGEPDDKLPIYVALVRTSGTDTMQFGRESFVLEFPDKSRTALATYDDYRMNYSRGRADTHVATSYIEHLNGQFPQPPFQWQGMDFFPRRASGNFPRDDFDIIGQQLWHGYLYFPLPDDPPTGGRYKLLVTPNNRDVTYVIDFPAFADDKSKGASR